MARATNLYIVEQYSAKTANYEIVTGFTVKHECAEYLRKLKPSELSRVRVKRVDDGLHRYTIDAIDDLDKLMEWY